MTPAARVRIARDLDLALRYVSSPLGRLDLALDPDDAITPEPWEASPWVDTEWGVVQLPDGAVATWYDGIGALTVRQGQLGLLEAQWTIAGPDRPGAAQRRAWIRAAIREVGRRLDARIVDGAIMSRQRGVA